jgi:hypothetical protein
VSSSQLVRVIEVRPCEGAPNHVVIKAQAVTQCYESQSGFSSSRSCLIERGQVVELTVAKDVFPHAAPDIHLDGRVFAYYKMQEPSSLPHAQAA